MGRGWVHGVRVAAAAKKGKIFTKIAKEITVSVKIMGPNPESNPRLRSALKEAQKNSVPRDTVDRAIKRGTGEGNEANFEEVTYEGYGPHGVAVIVDSLTDNRNRTVQDLRAAFVRGGGNLGEAGSVQWMFERVSLIFAKFPKGQVDAEEAAILAGANEVSPLEETGEFAFFGAPNDLDSIQKALTDAGWEIEKGELSFKAKTPTPLDEAQEKDLQDFLELVNDNDDVKKVYLSL
jgi:YebC/PmpR family DNA-binding regulatory protein